MQVNELKKEKLKREYAVKVDAGMIDRQMEEQLQSISKRVKIPGFRPGHIPVKILKQRYGKTVLGEVLEKTVNVSSSDVLKQKGERPALQPKIEITSYDEGKDLEYTLSYEVLPEIPTVDYAKITLEKLTFDVPEEEIEESLKRLLSVGVSYEAKPEEAKAEQGDSVKIDFTGYLKGEAFEGGAATNFTLELGSGQFIPGFEDQLIGSKAGDDLTVNVTFPADYHKEDLAGQPTEFKVKVHQVLAVKLPEMNDEYAKRFGMESMEKLREALRDQIAKDYEQVARTKMKKHLFDQMDKLVQFETPETMVDLEFNNIWQRLEEAKKQGDESLNKPEDELRAEYKAIAERRVRLGLVLAEIGRSNNIKISQDELSRAVMDHARMFPGQEKKVFEFYRQNPGQLEELRGPIIEEKAVDFILEQVTISPRKVTIDELIKDDEEENTSTSDKKESKKNTKK
jgi:trigger factor